jgi:hypothetical protein
MVNRVLRDDPSKGKHTAHCTLHTAHCTLHTAHCTFCLPALPVLHLVC